MEEHAHICCSTHRCRESPCHGKTEAKDGFEQFEDMSNDLARTALLAKLQGGQHPPHSLHTQLSGVASVAKHGDSNLNEIFQVAHEGWKDGDPGFCRGWDQEKGEQNCFTRVQYCYCSFTQMLFDSTT